MRNAQIGVASLYYPGGRTASGRPCTDGLKAAHKTLPFGTWVRVHNRANGKSVAVQIDDRGPFVPGRIIDLQPMAAHAIGMKGLANVIIEVEN